MAVRIITDSTSDIPMALQKELGIDIVPLSIIFGDKRYVEGIEMTNAQFYDMLGQSTKLPTTSQVNPDGFFDLFKGYVDSGDDVVGVFISSKLSGTYQSAVIARDMVDGGSIDIVDSKSATFGLALLVYEAIKLRDEGRSGREIADRLNALKGKIQFVAVVDTLKYLKMGGRLSSSAAVLGGMLHIKPLVSIIDGEVKSIGKERGQKAAFAAILKQLNAAPPDTEYTTVLGHSNVPGLMNDFIDFLGEQIPLDPKVICEIGGVIGTHAGPGCVGLAYIPR